MENKGFFWTTTSRKLKEKGNHDSLRSARSLDRGEIRKPGKQFSCHGGGTTKGSLNALGSEEEKRKIVDDHDRYIEKGYEV